MISHMPVKIQDVTMSSMAVLFKDWIRPILPAFAFVTSLAYAGFAFNAGSVSFVALVQIIW